MIYCMYSGMQSAWGALSFPWSFIANSLLLLQFPFIHSFLLSGRGRHFLRHLAPKNFAGNLSSTTYVIIVSLQALILFRLWSPSGIIWWHAQGSILVVLTLLYASAWLLLFKSMSDAGFALQTGMLGWRAVIQDKKPVYPSMPKNGMFRWCRQPIYFSFTLTLWTVPVWSPDQLVLAIVLTLYCLIGPILKERRFVRMYGKEFEDYQQNMPYWLPIFWMGLSKFHVRKKPVLNNQAIYSDDADEWWSGKHRWLRVMQSVVPARMKFFNSIVRNWQGKTVLDIGCGGGFMSEALAKCGAIVTGIDPSALAIEAARKHAQTEGLKIDYQIGAGEALPIASASFDYVVIVDVLEHVKSVNCVINEIQRVLKPGGLILFDTINRTPLASFIYIWLGERFLRIAPPGTHDPTMFIKPKELEEILLQYKFELGTIKGIGPVSFNHKLDIIFDIIPTTAIIFIGSATKEER